MNENPFAWRRVAVFVALLWALTLLSIWLASVVHVALGHCLTYAVSGGYAQGFRIFPLGGGRTYAAWGLSGDGSESFVQGGEFIRDWSGIFANWLIGTAALLWVVLRQRHSAESRAITLDLFLGVFAVVSVVPMLGYAIIGTYYAFGDPGEWGQRIPVVGKWLWPAMLVLTPFVTYAFMRPHVVLQSRLFGTEKSLKRLVFVCLVFGLTVGVWMSLSVAMDSHPLFFGGRPHVILREPGVLLSFYALAGAGGIAAVWRAMPCPLPAAPFPSIRSVAASVAAVALGFAILLAFQGRFHFPEFG